MGRTKIPKWESELWSYVCSGDGEHCPLYDKCRIRKECSWCIEEHFVEVSQMLEDRRLYIARWDFVKAESGRLGRPFQLVEMLAGKYLQMGNICSPPVPTTLVALCEKRRTIEVRLVPLTVTHGAIWRLKDRWIVHLNDKDTSAMKRYTLFHEAFHILAHGSGAPVFRKRGFEIGHFNEGLADYFSVCILMPREWVIEKWAQVKSVGRMAEIFDVPKISMWIRLRQLDLV